jgi:hypothetical protein
MNEEITPISLIEWKQFGRYFYANGIAANIAT